MQNRGQTPKTGNLERISRIVVAACLWAPIFANAAAHAADSVYRKGSRSPLQGTVAEFDKSGIRLKRSAGSTIEIPANEITRVRWDGEPSGLNLVRATEEAGHLQEALDGYRKGAEDAKPADTNLKIDLEFLMARTTAKMAADDADRLDEALDMLGRFVTSNPDHFRYYEAVQHLGALSLAKQDFARARTNFEILGSAPWPDYKMAANIGQARVLLRQDDVPGALEAFDAVIAMTPAGPLDEARRFEAILGKANALNRQQKFSDAVKVLDGLLEQVSVENTRLRAEAHVLQGRTLQAAGQAKQAVLAYLHVDVLYPAETALHAECLFYLSLLWNNVGRPDRAAAAAAKLESEYPKSDWTKKLKAQ